MKETDHAKQRIFTLDQSQSEEVFQFLCTIYISGSVDLLQLIGVPMMKYYNGGQILEEIENSTSYRGNILLLDLFTLNR